MYNTLLLQSRLFRSKLSFRTRIGMNLIQMKLLTFMILSNKCPIDVIKVLNTFNNLPKFHFVKSRKLSDLCSKIYKKSLNLSAAKYGFSKSLT